MRRQRKWTSPPGANRRPSRQRRAIAAGGPRRRGHSHAASPAYCLCNSGARAIIFADRPISACGGMGTKQRRTALQCFRAGAASINRPYWASLGYIVIQASSMLHIWPWRSRAILGRCDLRVWPRGGPHPWVQRVTPPGRHGPRRAGLSRGNLCQFWRPSGSAQKVLKQGAKGRLPIWPASWPAERRSHPPSAASNRR